jgi:dephospho-CoA kinase
VSSRLAARGAVIVDADAITKELQQPGTEVFAAIVAAFGDGVVATDGLLDRQALADVVFSDKEKLTLLNSIVHPAVGVEIFRRVQERVETDDVVVLDIPLLRKDGIYKVAGVLVVDAPVETAVQRLVEQRGMDEGDARARMANQLTREQRLEMADLVIDNSGTESDLDAEVDEAWTWIQTLPDYTVEISS